MNRTPQDEIDVALPPSLRFLKGLVIVLTLTMIGGVITVVGLLVTRMPQAFTAGPALPALPDTIALPEGAKAQAVTFGQGWIGVVVAGPDGAGERFLVYSPAGALRQTVALPPP